MIEKYDRIDESDWKRREQREKLVDDILDNYHTNPLRGERNHERAVKILQLYRDGLTFRQIASELNIDVAAVHRYYKRIIARLKGQQEMTT